METKEQPKAKKVVARDLTPRHADGMKGGYLVMKMQQVYVDNVSWGA